MLVSSHVRLMTGCLLLLLALAAPALPASAQKKAVVLPAPVPVQPSTPEAKALPDRPYVLRWQGARLVTLKDGPRRLPAFQGMQIRPESRLPFYQLRIEGAVASFTLREPVYEPLPADEARLLDAASVSEAPTPEVIVGMERRQPVSFVSFVPLRRSPQSGGLERLVGFDYTTTAGRTPAAGGRRTYKAQSALATGQWIKIGVAETGVYRIDRNQLQALGLNPNSLDARNLQLWGNGGRLLPQLNSAPRVDDLMENAIMVNESNGSFNWLVFYAQGPVGWRFDAGSGRYVHEQNIYSDSAYYFLTVGDTPGRRVALQAAPGAPTGSPVTAFDAYAVHEVDRVNLLKQGREWLGEEFSSFNPAQDFSFSLEGIDTRSLVQVTSSVVGTTCSGAVTFAASVNGQPMGSQACSAVNCNYTYHPAGTASLLTMLAPSGSIGPDGQTRIRLAFSGGSAGATGYLNYLEINCQRALRRYGSQTSFRARSSVGAGRISEFSVGNCDANSYVWDVTNPLRARQQSTTLVGNTASFVAATDSLREFVVFNPAEVRADVRGFGGVPNQNLHAFNKAGDMLDLVIIAHPKTLGQARRLADHRRQHDGLRVEVVTLGQVYNEFSSGRPDLTAIRDLMKMLYDRAAGTDNLLNLLLFGDASYDYKSNEWYRQRPGAPFPPTPDNTNLIPVYEARQSLDPISAFSSEDYYGLLDDNEGTWEEGPGSELLDIGVGRLPARDEADAIVFVNKLIHYDEPSTFGKWRNQLTFVTDDDDNAQYSYDAEKLINQYIEPRYPAYNSRKLYLDLFPQIIVPSGKRSPVTYSGIEHAMEQGNLLMTYIGHGGETGWAAEKILDIPQINNWRNADKLAFFVTATCEFGRYDDPARSSGAEYTLYNPGGGAIGLFTTTRPVYANDNQTLNEQFNQIAFEPVGGRMRRIGEILRVTKTRTGTAALGSRNFALLGDPSMRLAYPQLKASVTKINGQPLATTDTINALQTVALEGLVQDLGGQTVADFNGQLQLTVYEKSATARLLDDERPSDPNVPYNPLVRSVEVRENIIYDGLVSVTGGQWRAQFVVPKDIAYNYGYGKISLYAWSADRDAAGATTSIVIGGSNPNTVQDRTPPAIGLFMNDSTFVNGGSTGTDATLLANLSDASGINTAGTGIGHEITAVLDGDKSNVTVLNQYYTANVDSYTSGRVRYLFKGLAPGPHTVTLKAWDTFNNSAERSLDFVVANSAGLALDHVLNYPNPFANHTTFHFDHNRAGDDLDVQVQIFTVAGRLVCTLNVQAPGAQSHVNDVTWDGRDDYGDVLARGVYVYKVNVRSTRDGAHTSKYEKLVILN